MQKVEAELLGMLPAKKRTELIELLGDLTEKGAQERPPAAASFFSNPSCAMRMASGQGEHFVGLARQPRLEYLIAGD